MVFFTNHDQVGMKMAMVVSIGVACTSALAQQTSFGLGLGSGREAIQIDANEMEMRDREGIAIFTGDVSVTQGERILRAGKMIVHYKKPEAKEPQGENEDRGGGLGSTGIEKLEVSDKVYVKTGTQIATGDAGVFDAKANTMVMTGEKVVLVDGDNVATGCKLTAHMDTGRAILESCTAASTRQGRVSIILNNNN